VKAICGLSPTTATKQQSPAPQITTGFDPNDPNVIVIGVNADSLNAPADDDLPDGSDSPGPTDSSGYGGSQYGDGYFETVCQPCQCPEHTYRCNDFNQLQKWGWIFVLLEFLLLLLASSFFFYETWVRKPEQRMWFAVAGMINAISCITAFIALTGGGYSVRCWDQRHFYYIRYVDWILTAPQILWILSAVAKGGDELTRTNPFGAPDPNDKFKTVIDSNLVLLMVASVMMIASGLVGSFIEEAAKWLFWVFGVLCFVAVIAVHRYITPPPNKVSSATYKMLSSLIIFVWSIYGILWIFDEGLGFVSINAEAIIFFFLTLLGKVLFGAMVVFLPWQQDL
jgi:bacteriorhodopsin